jgi:hypothetical protein
MASLANGQRSLLIRASAPALSGARVSAADCSPKLSLTECGRMHNGALTLQPWRSTAR